MGQPKMLLPWGDTTVLGHLVFQWRAFGAAQIGVVCAENDRACREELDRVGVSICRSIDNPAPDRGMFSSIQCAAQWAGWQSILTHFVIALGDQPHLHPDTLRALMDFAAAHPNTICQPASGGQRRHPVVLPRSTFEELAESTASTFKDFLEKREVAVCACNDPGLAVDIDHPEDYLRVLQLLRKG